MLPQIQTLTLIMPPSIEISRLGLGIYVQPHGLLPFAADTANY